MKLEKPCAIYAISTSFDCAGYPQIVELSCEMPCHGWCKLQKSEQWKGFLEALAAAQKEQ